jgi:hypothetical protein
MIYRILTDATISYWNVEQEDYVRVSLGLVGAGRTLSAKMWELHLPAPSIGNQRARFWFTERGWDRFGRALAREGRQRGHVVKVIRRKNPRRSQIVYADEWQVALLPAKGRIGGA